MWSRFIVATVGVITLTAACTAPAAAAPIASFKKVTSTSVVPASMAALGDSVTRAYNTNGWYQDAPQNSWATGDDPGIKSQYQRILVKNPKIQGKSYNDAKTGAKSDALVGQAQSAVSQQADYVTILMGANDACTDSESAMTPVDQFGQRVTDALNTLQRGRPGVRVFIASIPDLGKLYDAGKGHLSARAAWSLLGVCKSMLAHPDSNNTADQQRRSRVRERVIAYNKKLDEACRAANHAASGSCRFDGNAVFNANVTVDELSRWDYFHPNVAGQKQLADVTYRAGYGW